MGAILDEHLIVIVKMGILHPQGLEDELPGQLPEALAPGPLGDDREEEIAGVAVEKLRARSEVELFCRERSSRTSALWNSPKRFSAYDLQG